MFDNAHSWLVRASLIGLLACQAFGQVEDEECLPCHQEDVDLEREHDVHWDEGVMCVECHAELLEWEFSGDLDEEHDESPAQCVSCHRDAVKSFHGGAHYEDDMECSECHGDHQTKWVKDWLPNSQRTCLMCHDEQDEEVHASIHIPYGQRDRRGYPICVDCHTSTHLSGNPDKLPLPTKRQLQTEACLSCHEKDTHGFTDSAHYIELFENNNPDAPGCVDCHNGHDVAKPTASFSGTEACLNCHEDAALSMHHAEGDAISEVECSTCHSGHLTSRESIADLLFRPGGLDNCLYCHSTDNHQGVGLAHDTASCAEALEQPDLSCIDCHTFHWEVADGKAIPGSNHQSCEACHEQEAEDYALSAHARSRAVGNSDPAYCTDCHGETAIKTVNTQFTPEEIVESCAECHSDKPLMLSYGVNPNVVDGFEDTYHGQLYDLLNSDLEFAVCTNCHGHHDILEPEDPGSFVARDKLLSTCQECHEDADEGFIRYIVHPQRPDQEELIAAVTEANRPKKTLRPGVSPEDLIPPPPPGGSKTMAAILHGADVFMKLLFVSVMCFFSLHTLLWFQRGVRQRHQPSKKYFKRFTPFERFLHILVNISFLTLAFTGLPQTFSHTAMGKWLLENVISIELAQDLHYWAAGVTGLYFVLHLGQVAVGIFKKGWRPILSGPDSLVPRLKDWHDFVGHLRWFFKGGEKPKFGRWTYWEKFDYLAVFWGVAVIGISGVIRWQEELFGSLFGGEFVTLASTIHKEEALLATAFIFLVHFFNTHMRAEKFPMDVCVYTGIISEEEMKEERPEQWELLQEQGRLDELRCEAKSTVSVLIAYLWGSLALAIGIFLLIMIAIGFINGQH